jgi:hypothetical protein
VKHRYLLVLALAGLPVQALAQRQTKENVGAWFTWAGDVAFDPRWGFEWDGSLRRSGPLDEWQQILVRGSVRYTLASGARIGVGLGRNEAFPFGELPIDHRRPEWRIFEQLTLTQSVSRVQVTHRYRNEQRWVGFLNGSAGTERYDWVRTNRTRYLIRGSIPLQGPQADVGEWYTNLSTELFLNWGSQVQNNVFDQLRTQAILGRRINNVLAMELGFLEQFGMKPNGTDLERNHILLLALNTSFRREAAVRPPR